MTDEATETIAPNTQYTQYKQIKTNVFISSGLKKVFTFLQEKNQKKKIWMRFLSMQTSKMHMN